MFNDLDRPISKITGNKNTILCGTVPFILHNVAYNTWFLKCLLYNQKFKLFTILFEIGKRFP